MLIILYIWTGTNVFNINVIDKLRIKFKIGKENTVPFYFLCLDITSNNSTHIMLSQNNYIMPLSKSNLCNEELISSEDKTQSAVGKLLWISTQTRSDVSHLSQCIKNTMDENYKCEIKILRNLQKTNVNITYQPLGANSISSLLFMLMLLMQTCLMEVVKRDTLYF